MAGIEHVSDTARWVAVYRAWESERPDALFNDPWARILAGEQGEQIVREVPRGRAAAWAMIVRTAVFDEFIHAAVHREHVDLVVNLAAGLDVRPWRMDLPAKLRWVDVDLPEILNYKLDTLGGARPRCAYEGVRADLTDPAQRRRVLASIAKGSERALVISEGLLIYLEPDDVAALATDLASIPAYRSWLIDLASPRLLTMMRRSWGKATDEGNASFKFAPEEGTEFFRSYGWTEAAFRASWDEAHRLHREMPFAWFWRFIGRFMSEERREAARRMSGIVLLKRAG